MIIQCVNCNSEGIIDYHEDKRKEICTICKGNGYIILTEETEAYGTCYKGNCDD
jgi:hypothetical protein